MRAAEIPLQGEFFDADGKPTKLGALLVRTLNEMVERTGGKAGQAFGPLPEYAVSALPSAIANERMLIYVSNESGGAVPAFSDGTNWRRVTDRAVVS